MNYDERIAQCDSDVEALLTEKQRLKVAREAAAEIQWKHGDIASAGNWKKSHSQRLLIRGQAGLMIFGLDTGCQIHLGIQTVAEWAKKFHYVRIGNIFSGE